MSNLPGEKFLRWMSEVQLKIWSRSITYRRWSPQTFHTNFWSTISWSSQSVQLGSWKSNVSWQWTRTGKVKIELEVWKIRSAAQELWQEKEQVSLISVPNVTILLLIGTTEFQVLIVKGICFPEAGKICLFANGTWISGRLNYGNCFVRTTQWMEQHQKYMKNWHFL